MAYVVEFLFLISPLLALIFFLICLILFLRAKSANKKFPGTYSENQIKSRLAFLIASSVIAFVLVSFAVAIVGLMYMAVAYM